MTGTLLEVDRVSKSFGGVAAVREVSLALEEGGITALIGPNGAGKTTLYNLLSGELTPTHGSVRFRGSSIAGLPPYRINRLGLARSFQISNVFAALTAGDNVQVPLIAHSRRVGQVWRARARDAGLRREALDLLELVNLAGVADVPAATLAYGQKRLLELAIALASRPALVLLDEPAAGLTPAETRDLMALLRRLATAHPYTFFLTEHDMEVVFGLAQTVHVLHRGMLLASGAPAAIRADPAVRAAYLGEAPAETDGTAPGEAGHGPA